MIKVKTHFKVNKIFLGFVDVNTLAENKRSLLPQIPVRKNNH